MARVANPFQAQTPIGAAIAGLGQAIFGGTQSPSELQKQQLENQLLRARTTSAQTSARKDQAVLDSQSGVARGLEQALERMRNDPVAPGSRTFIGPVRDSTQAAFDTRLAERTFSTRQAISGAGLLSNPRDLANLELYRVANNPTATDAQVTRARAGAGGVLGVNQAVSTSGQAGIADRNLASGIAQDAAKIAATPLSETQVAAQILARQSPETQDLTVGPTNSQVQGRSARNIISAAEGGPELATQEERLHALGANAQGPVFVKVLDPNTQTMHLVPRRLANNPNLDLSQFPQTSFPQAKNPGDVGLTKTTQAQLEQSSLAMSEFIDDMNIAETMAQKNPHIFGLGGDLRRLGQDVGLQIDSLASIFGGSDFDSISVELQTAGVSERRFDPALSNIEKLGTLLAYQAAGAIAQQTGKALSDKDFEHFRKVVGDPTAMLSSQEKFLAGLKLLEQATLRRMKRRHHLLTTGSTDFPIEGATGSPQDASDAELLQILGLQ